MSKPPHFWQQAQMQFTKEISASAPEAAGTWYPHPLPPTMPATSFQAEPESLLTYIRTIWASKGLICLCAISGLALAVALSLSQIPEYEARASIEVLNYNQDFLNLGKVDPTSVNYDADSYIQTQIQLLHSDSLLDRVYGKVNFEESNRPRPQSVFGTIVRKVLFLEPPKQLNPREEALLAASGNLKIRGSGMTRIIEISTSTPHPKLTAAYVNLLADEFIQQSLESRWKSAQNVTGWLSGQLGELRQKLEAAEKRLRDYTAESGLIIPTDSQKGGIAEQKLRQVQDELFRAQADLVSKETRFELASNAPPDSLSELLEDGALRDYQLRLTDLRRQHAELTTTLTPAHPQVQRLEAQIEELKATAERQRTNLIKRIGNEHTAAKRRVQLLERDYQQQIGLTATQNQKAVGYEMLKREVETTRSLYEGILQKVKEGGFTQALRVANVRVVDYAKAPMFPSKPNRKLYSILGLFGGFLFGAGFVVMRQHVDHSLRHPGEIRQLTNVRELGAISGAAPDPASAALALRRPLALIQSSLQRIGLKNASGNAESLEMVSWRKKTSLTALCYRTALGSILQPADGASPKVLVFVSPGPKEGKTTTVSNLGIALAEILSNENQQVLLIDADFRKPRLHKIFDLPSAPGFSEILTNRNPASFWPKRKMFHKTEVPGLFILTAGAGGEGACQLLHLPRLKETIERLQKDFTYILIDSPPAATFSDTRALAGAADAVVVVARSGRTDRAALMNLMQQLSDDHTAVLGAILTDWTGEDKTLKGYYSYYRS